MGYQLRGTYLTHCDCMQICPCSVDEKPTGRDGQCHGLVVVNIDNGSLDDTDLSGTKVVLSYWGARQDQRRRAAARARHR